MRERLRYLHDQRGITFDTIALRTELDVETLKMQYHGVNKQGNEILSCQMSSRDKIFSARFQPEDGTWFPSVGIRRRLQALMRVGFTTPWMAARLPRNGDHRMLFKVITGQKSRQICHVIFAQAVIEMYDKYADVDPATEGFAQCVTGRARSIARKHGYALPACWDSDTIDDPDAHPEWTGRCGTSAGWNIHQRDGIPLCPRCEEAGPPKLSFNGEKLRAHRERCGFSRLILAERVGMNESTIFYWETGRSLPRGTKKLEAVLTVLDLTLDDVCE